MNKLISISKPVATLQEPEGPLMISATADSQYEPEEEMVTVELDTAIFPQECEGEYRSWLPAHETIREHVPQQDAAMLARDVFEHWSEKVRRAAANLSEQSPDSEPL